MMKTNIYKYIEYRTYLRDYYSAMKAVDRDFTYRYFADRAGMKAPNFLQLLILGKRNLRESSIANVSRAIGHDSREAFYFRNMVLFDQASTSEEKDEYFQALTDMRESELNMDLLTKAQLAHYTHWYYHAIRELLGFYQLHPDEQYAFRHLAALLEPTITESEARKAVKNMLKLGMLHKDPRGRIVQSTRFITTGDEVRSYYVRSYHETMMKAAFKSQDRFEPAVRDVSSLTVSISDTGFRKIKSEIQQFRKHLLEIVREDCNPSNVYQVNFQLFPLTNPKKTKKYKEGGKAGRIKSEGRS
jgi:uncharacterized protein (TIGR02147 family)